MRRADRLFAIVQALRGGRLRTAEQLAAQLEVSPRTIYRDLADLQGQGVPIDGERGVGYLLRDSFFLPPLSLTRLEMEALQWGVSFVVTHGDDELASAARELKVKLEAAQTGLATIAGGLTHGARLTRSQRDILRSAREAVARRAKLRLRYRDAVGVETSRVIRPLELQHWGTNWTLAAWCELREDFRTFRIDRLDECLATGETFRPEKGKDLAAFLERVRGEACRDVPRQPEPPVRLNGSRASH